MKKILAAALLSVVAVPVFAAPAPDSGYYAGVDVGNGKIRLGNCGASGCGTSSKDNDTVAGILLGYQYNKNLAIEAKFTGAGRWTDITGGQIKSDPFALAAVGIAPVNDSFSVYGKLGIANNQIKVSGIGTHTNTRRTSTTYGVGAQYNATSIVGIRLGYDHYYGKADTTAVGAAAGSSSLDADSDVWAIGAVYKF